MVAPAQRPARPAAGPRRLPLAQRVRVGLGVTFLLVLCVLLMATLAGLQQRWWLMLVEVLTAAVAGGCGLQIWRTGSVRRPVTVLLTWMFTLLLVAVCSKDGLAVAISPWMALLVLFALFMLGPRRGAIFAGVALGMVVLSLVLHRTGAGPPLSFLATWDTIPRVLFMALATGLIGLLGLRYESAQQRTLGELEEALVTSEHGERQREVLFESTTAAICSIDRERRLVLCNRAFADLAGVAEPGAGTALAHILAPAQWARWQLAIARVLSGGGPITFEEPPPAGQDAPHRETTIQPIVAAQPMSAGGEVVGVTVFSHDITERKRAEAETRQLHQALVRVSRQAGMATVAGEVLHNAGNVLNSTGVSVSMLRRYVRRLRSKHLVASVAMLEAHRDDLDAFLSQDPRGRHLLAFLRGLAGDFEQQKHQLSTEVRALRKSIEHLTHVIHAQRSRARAHGAHEAVSIAAVIDAALGLQVPSWEQIEVSVERRIAALPPLHTDKHRVIEILVNLVSNARDAVRDSGRIDKRICIRAETAGPDRLRVAVEDNGVGIAPAQRDELFRLGFTTKHDGNGIGLHASAMAARQLGGSLTFRSDGPGQGAVFTLELPMAPAVQTDGGPVQGTRDGAG
jgi:two-component system sensor kinase FixL